jgi:hypothetical protein
LLRKHRFSPTGCGRDPEYPGNRQTADLHFRYLTCKALAASRFDMAAAARLLAGEADPSLLEKAAARAATFVDNLRARVESEPAAELEQALTDDWKGLGPAVLALVSALRGGASQRATEPPGST